MPAPVMQCKQDICAQKIGHLKTKQRMFISFWKNFNIENRVAWFLAELCKAKKGVQKDKRNQPAGQSSLGGCSSPSPIGLDIGVFLLP
jgi:hypothetical protein